MQLGRLQAVLTQPTNAGPCAMILLNAGLIPRSGPFRLHTLLSRALAQLNMLSVRLDLAGVGDSDQQTIAKDLQQTVVDDVQQVIAQLRTQFAVNKIVLFGVCTGADFAHRIALQEKSVIGFCGVDGYLYPTWRARCHQALPVLKSPSRLMAAVFRRVRGQGVVAVDGDSGFSWQLPPQAQARHEYAQLRQRHMHMLMIFTGSYFEYQYSGQFRDGIPTLRDDKNTIEHYFPQSDHLFSIKADQQQLIDHVVMWVAAISV
jgi:hypothetical protein